MTPQVISLSSATSSAWIPVDYKQNPYNIDIAVVLSNTPNLTYKVEYTLDNVFNSSITPTAFSHSSLVGLTANATGTIKSPVRAIRLTITSWTSGTATMTALQGIVNKTEFTVNGDLGTDLEIHAEKHALLGSTRRRTMTSTNLSNPTTSFDLIAVESIGTSVAVNTEPQTVTVNCTSTGAGRLGRAKITNLEVGKYYEYSIEVSSFNLPNKASMTGHIFGIGYTPTSGTQAISAQAANLVPGGRISIRFQASTVAEYFRCGLNINNAGLTLTNGDSIVFTRPAVYEVSGLTGSEIPYGWSTYGTVGGAPNLLDSVGSCVLCCGDSWFDAITDPPSLLCSTYQREVIVSATGGLRLDQIDTALGSLIAAGSASLNPSYRHPPGIAIIEGGINDITASATGWTMWSRMESILAKLEAKNIIPIIITPTLPTDSTFSNANTRAASDLYHKLVRASGVAYIDGPLNFCNADGTANTTYMTDDAGAHLHLLPAGITLLTRLMDEKIRDIELSGASAAAALDW